MTEVTKQDIQDLAQGMQSNINDLSQAMNAGFQGVQNQFEKIDTRFDEVKDDLQEIRTDVRVLKSKVGKIETVLDGVAGKVNTLTVEGAAGTMQLRRAETRITKVEERLESLAVAA